MKNNGYDIFKDSLRENWKLQATSNVSIKNKFTTKPEKKNISLLSKFNKFLSI